MSKDFSVRNQIQKFEELESKFGKIDLNFSIVQLLDKKFRLNHININLPAYHRSFKTFHSHLFATHHNAYTELYSYLKKMSLHSEREEITKNLSWLISLASLLENYATKLIEHETNIYHNFAKDLLKVRTYIDDCVGFEIEKQKDKVLYELH